MLWVDYGWLDYGLSMERQKLPEQQQQVDVCERGDEHEWMENGCDVVLWMWLKFVRLIDFFHGTGIDSHVIGVLEVGHAFVALHGFVVIVDG